MRFFFGFMDILHINKQKDKKLFNKGKQTKEN